MNYNDPVEVYETTFTHIYDVTGFSVSKELIDGDKDYHPPRTHSCLRHGYWCWKNAIENPKMAIRYILNLGKRLIP